MAKMEGTSTAGNTTPRFALCLPAAPVLDSAVWLGPTALADEAEIVPELVTVANVVADVVTVSGVVFVAAVSVPALDTGVDVDFAVVASSEVLVVAAAALSTAVSISEEVCATVDAGTTVLVALPHLEKLLLQIYAN